MKELLNGVAAEEQGNELRRHLGERMPCPCLQGVLLYLEESVVPLSPAFVAAMTEAWSSGSMSESLGCYIESLSDQVIGTLDFLLVDMTPIFMEAR